MDAEVAGPAFLAFARDGLCFFMISYSYLQIVFISAVPAKEHRSTFPEFRGGGL
jgi:hypothetical protein